MNRVRDMRGGKDNESDFATRMRGDGVWAQLIAQRIEKAAQRNRLALRGWFDSLDAAAFVAPARPPKPGDRTQLDLF